MSNAEVILAALSDVLSAEDDVRLWSALVTVLVDDVGTVITSHPPRDEILLEIGSCAHWLRPHQLRWTAAGGFAWPVGYGNDGTLGRDALPAFERSRLLHLDPITGAWAPTRGRPGRRPLVLRVAVPIRSTRHPQAAIHTIWMPGSPGDPDVKSTRCLGFRLTDGEWKLVADSRPLWR